MARLQDEHLTLHELRVCLSARLSNATALARADTDQLRMEEHILACGQCRELLDQEQLLARISFQPQDSKALVEPVDCPSEQKWRELAAGLHSPTETHVHLEHAMLCAHCAAQIKMAAEEFADEITDEEREVLRTLRSSDADWQDSLARRLQRLYVASPKLTTAWWRRHAINLQVAIGLSALALLAVGFFWAWTQRPSNRVNRLLSRAYSEQRTTDLRMADARYSPVEAFRGSEISHLQRPTSLLEAELLISKELVVKPDDPFWLDARAKADLMDDNYASALSMLKRAHQYAPEDQAIVIDLASAFFLRAEELKRSEDYGRAIDLLGQVLSRNPNNELARFNRAIAAERLLLFEQAAEDWHRYLELDPRSPWSEEARKRLAALQEKIDLHHHHSQGPLLTPSGFVTLVQDNNQHSREVLNSHIERYFEIALREWVPEAFSTAGDSSRTVARQALDCLSQVLISKHQDYWLADFLKQLDARPASKAGLRYLGDFMKFNQIADLENAHKSAINAVRSFRETSNPPGELLSEFHASYADQLAHLVDNCLSEARAQEDPRVAEKYPWLHAQFALESAACTNLSDEGARKLAHQALQLAKQHNYPSIELRATTFLAQLYQYLGDTSSAWKYSTEGLARYWAGDYPAIRGYSLYVGIDLVAEDAKEWFLDAQVLKEASTFIADDPDFELRAMEQHRLANALAMTGDFTGAEESLKNADTLFLRSSDGTRKANLEFEAQIGLAKLDLFRSHPAMAIERLEPLREKVHGLSDQDLAFDYFRDIGLAYFAAGKYVEARSDLHSALEFAEKSLRTNRDERERLIWSQKTDQAYRAIVQLGLSGSPRDAFAQWEWFKGASLRGSRIQDQNHGQKNESFVPASVSLPFAVPPDTVVLSYAVLPEGTFAWTYSHEGVRQFRLPITALELSSLSRKFSDHCSRPDSALETLLAESRLLYEKLVEPIEPALTSYGHLLIEPDEVLWLIPFDALLNKSSIYLGDRYAISLSPGLNYLAVSPPWQGISKESRILIAGDPQTSGKKSLPDAEEEAKGIARQFRSNELLLKGDANYTRIAEQMKDAEIFHFSGHVAASPNGAGLVLGDSTVMDVARVGVSQFPRLKLAVLSACNSANGAGDVFDDRDSLARLLVGAGVTEVVATRWMVNSRAAAALMPEFYAQLLSGKQLSLALRDAKHKLRGNKEFAHPFYWASFSVFGKS